MKKLYKSRTDVKLAGVCGGVAEYFNVDPSLVRLITAAAVVFGGMGLWVYIVAAVIMPTAPAGSYKEEEIQPQAYSENNNDNFNN